MQFSSVLRGDSWDILAAKPASIGLSRPLFRSLDRAAGIDSDLMSGALWKGMLPQVPRRMAALATHTTDCYCKHLFDSLATNPREITRRFMQGVPA